MLFKDDDFAFSIKKTVVENQSHVYKLHDPIELECNSLKRVLTSKVKGLVSDLFLNFDGKPSRIFNQLQRKKYLKKLIGCQH